MCLNVNTLLTYLLILQNSVLNYGAVIFKVLFQIIENGLKLFFKYY